MKLLNLYVLTALFSNGRPLVTTTKKICKDCKYFIGNNIECGKFGDTNLVTGHISYDSARSVRNDEKKCGQEAIHFEENQLKLITVPYYFMKGNRLLLFPGSFVGLYVYLLAQYVHK